MKKVSEEESNKYFNTRPFESKLGAILSDQSSEIPLDFDFTQKLDELKYQINPD